MDRPSEEVRIQTGPRSGGSQSAPNPDRLQQQVDKLAEQEELKRLREAQEADNQAIAKQEKDNCEQARSNLQTLTTQSRIRVEGADGEFKFLTPEEIIEQRKKAEEIIKRDCKNQP